MMPAALVADLIYGRLRDWDSWIGCDSKNPAEIESGGNPDSIYKDQRPGLPEKEEGVSLIALGQACPSEAELRYN